MIRTFQLSKAYDNMIAGAIVTGVEYIEDNSAIETLVLGISGGIDSALTAALARKVCDSTGTKLLGYTLFIDGNKGDEMRRAENICKAYCDEYKYVNLNDAFLSLMKGIDKPLYMGYHNTLSEMPLKGRIRVGNIKARTRMVYLYNQANRFDGMVLSTDNLTERYLGFWTLHGDVGDFGFLQELWKTEVYGMAELIGDPLLGCVNANPTDGLGITDSDVDQMLPDWTAKMGDHRAAYEAIDDILIDYLGPEDNRDYNPNHPVIQRYESTKFKRANPVNAKRDILIWRHNAR